QGEVAHITKAQYLHGMLQRKVDRHKQEGRANYPGRSVALPRATGAVKCRDGATEVSRGRSSDVKPAS
ncbi:MAG: hypothetical protein KKB38_03565, partial [Gammaproteobacteria bacterium]|nr:hypothetical protein [Gammaproteobacteria bacterium]